MGKQKRAREKFHIASARLKANTTNPPEGTREIQGLPINNWPVKDNIFAGIDIDFNSIKKSLVEDDKISVRSIAKSCKYDKNGKLLTKQEKRKLKHELFLGKIDALEQMKREAKRKRKKRKPVSNSKHENVEISSCTKLERNSFDLDLKAQSKLLRKIVKKKGTKKAKERKKDLLDGVAAFKQILDSKAFKTHPQKIISESIQRLALS